MSTLAMAAIGTVTGVIGAAAMYVPARLARYDAATYVALAEEKLTEAEQRDAEFERTRNLPWHYATEPAAGELEEQPEPWIADESLWAAAALQPVNGEVLHVEHATGELSAVLRECETADQGVMYDTPPALSDRPAADEDEVGDEQPGEALSGAPARLLDRLWDWLYEALADVRNLFLSDERRAKEFWADDEHDHECKIELDPTPLVPPAAAEPEPVRIVRRDRYRPAGETGQFPYVKVAGAPRHAAPEPEMPAINQTIPAQRTDGDL